MLSTTSKLSISNYSLNNITEQLEKRERQWMNELLYYFKAIRNNIHNYMWRCKKKFSQSFWFRSGLLGSFWWFVNNSNTTHLEQTFKIDSVAFCQLSQCWGMNDIWMLSMDGTLFHVPKIRFKSLSERFVFASALY